jgi:hypothetical protein
LLIAPLTVLSEVPTEPSCVPIWSIAAELTATGGAVVRTTGAVVGTTGAVVGAGTVASVVVETIGRVFFEAWVEVEVEVPPHAAAARANPATTQKAVILDLMSAALRG